MIPCSHGGGRTEAGPQASGPWCAHTLSQGFSRSLIEVLLGRDFIGRIKASNQLTLRKADFPGRFDLIIQNQEKSERFVLRVLPSEDVSCWELEGATWQGMQVASGS